MKKIVEFFRGKKTYIIALVVAAVGISSSLGHPMPDWVLQVLAALGLITLRAGVDNAINKE
jgi:type IV secretory pathway VirB2 component (pilin)